MATQQGYRCETPRQPDAATAQERPSTQTTSMQPQAAPGRHPATMRSRWASPTTARGMTTPWTLSAPRGSDSTPTGHREVLLQWKHLIDESGKKPIETYNQGTLKQCQKVALSLSVSASNHGRKKGQHTPRTGTPRGQRANAPRQGLSLFRRKNRK